MAHCSRCSTSHGPVTEMPASRLSLCPEHALGVLEDISRRLAATLAALERATYRATFVVASGAGG